MEFSDYGAAEAVAQAQYREVDVSLNKDAPPDAWFSYRVSFNKFKQLAPNYQPQVNSTNSDS